MRSRVEESIFCVEHRRVAIGKERMGRGFLPGSRPKQQKASLRASWLFRQRAAGRLGKKDERKQPIALLFTSLPCFAWLPIFPPDAIVAIAWDWLVSVSLAYVSIFTPLQVVRLVSPVPQRSLALPAANGMLFLCRWSQVAFYSVFDTVAWHTANVCVEAFFIASVAFRFRCGFNHDGVYVSDPHFIAAHYLQDKFLLDVIACFP